MDGGFFVVWIFGRRIRKAALGDSPVDCRNRRGFSAEKRIHFPPPSKTYPNLLPNGNGFGFLVLVCYTLRYYAAGSAIMSKPSELSP